MEVGSEGVRERAAGGWRSSTAACAVVRISSLAAASVVVCEDVLTMVLLGPQAIFLYKKKRTYPAIPRSPFGDEGCWLGGAC